MRLIASVATVLVTCTSGGASEPTGPRIDLARAEAAFVATFPDLCEGALKFGAFDGLEPEAHEIVLLPSYEGGGERRVVLYGFHCNRGAYNTTTVWMMERGYGGILPVTFAVPELNFTYADDAETVIETFEIEGFTTRIELVNAEFDADTLTMNDYGKWRGLGDAFSAGEWRLRDDRFVLTRYTVDPTMNGAIDPFIVFEATDGPQRPVLLD